MKGKNHNSGRNFLKISLWGLDRVIVAERSFDYFGESKAKGKIVIVGGVAAGITMAAYLTDQLSKPDITIIEPNETHYILTRIHNDCRRAFTADEITKPNKDLIPGGITC